ncbi:MAG: translation initiation factor IF-2, partial [Planctomycetes bacterium]|nr:translation initiation factor IF-2 [Planctomycetota bacterium]
SKDIMAEAQNHGIEVQNHMGSLTEAQANILRAFLYVPPKEKPPEPAPVVAEVAPPQEAEAQAPAAKAPPQQRELSPVSPPGQRREPQPPARDEKPVEAPRKSTRETAPVQPPNIGRPKVQPAAPVEPAAPSRPAAREMPISGEIGSRIVNRPPQAPEVESQDEAPEVTKPVISRTVSPVTPTIETREIKPLESREPTREVPRRRQATILGHKDLPKPPEPQARTPQMGGFDSAGMIQTKSDGSRRTFVRAPQRGGGGGGGSPGGMRGGPQGRRGGPGGRFQQMPRRKSKQQVERPTSCEIQLPITVKDLSASMGLKANLIIESLIKNHNMFPSINTTLDKDTVELIGLEFECEIKVSDAENLEKQFVEEELESWDSVESDLKPRAPIVTFLGHVDHGKTSLLDHIRKARVAKGEHGGITQHIGAYRVKTPNGDVVFLDTPGHQAFTEMRARGANVTDLVVLVVAADDGVKPQTEEAVAHARAANTPIVVAINKCDKPDANPMQVKQQLVGLGLQPEDWGGDTVCVEVSALTGQGVDDLLEYLGLVSEMLNLTADAKRPAVGTVIEAYQKKGEGNVARIIVNDGTMRRGDTFLVGHVVGKVKALRGPDGKVLKEAGPAMPVEVPGLSEMPQAGDKLYVVTDVNKAKELAIERTAQMREERLAQKQHTNLENLLKQASTGQVAIILKADTQGSLEVLKKEIMNLAHEEITPKIIHAAVGGVTETDITLADASDAVVLGFHVTDSAQARRLAESKGVEIRHYMIIYKLLEELRDALEGQLAPEEREKITGHIEVLKTFKVSRIGTIAGCRVLDGYIRNSARVRVTRDGILVHEGKIASLRHIKDDVKEVKENQECGIRLDNFDDVKVGDIFEPYEIEKIKRSLSD